MTGPTRRSFGAMLCAGLLVRTASGQPADAPLITRAIPGSQTAAEVAAVIVDTIVHKRTDVYTRPDGRDLVMAYYTNL